MEDNVFQAVARMRRLFAHRAKISTEQEVYEKMLRSELKDMTPPQHK